MASIQLQTSTTSTAIGPHQRALVLASARLYAILNDGSNLVYQYSDDDGATWSSETTVKSGANHRGTAFYDSVNGRLNFVYAGENSAGQGLFYRAITSNVTSGTPGSLSTEVTIDAGGTNLGIQWPFAFHSPTATRPRYWVIANKWTSSTTIETRVWNVNVATVGDADTAGNWVTTNFTNLGGNSDANQNKNGIGFYWTIGANKRVTFIFSEGTTADGFEAVTFDPDAVTPTPGTVTSSLFAPTGSTGVDSNVQGPLFCGAAVTDYAVFGRYDAGAGNWDFFKSTDGTTWTQPTGWSNVTSIGRAAIAISDDDFYIVHSNAFGTLSSSVSPLAYRFINTTNDNLGGAVAFSDTDGNSVAVPLNTGTSKVYALYRGSTASPYTVRSDFVSIGGGADTTAPSNAEVTIGTVTSTTIPFTAVMPADADVANYKVKYSSGASAPATESDGTEAVASTATSANAEVEGEITGLTAGTQYSAKVFVQDSSGNWNTGAVFQAVTAATMGTPTRYKADGVTVIADAFTPGGNGVILEYQLAANMFLTGGANAHFRLRIGSDEATPPTVNTFDLTSYAADGTFKYESATDVWTTVPASGLTSANWTKKLRVFTGTVQSSQFGSARVEQ